MLNPYVTFVAVFGAIFFGTFVPFKFVVDIYRIVCKKQRTDQDRFRIRHPQCKCKCSRAPRYGTHNVLTQTV